MTRKLVDASPLRGHSRGSLFQEPSAASLLSPLRFAATIFLALMLTGASSPRTIANAREPGDQPNIVLIVADDLGYGELGCQGNPQIPTPHVDALAEGGLRFTQAYVTAPNCSPSRAGLLAGQIPTRFGYEFNPIGARNDDPGTGIPSKLRLLPETLQSAGYSTGLVGKWHLGGAADYHPQRNGFDYFFGFSHEGHYFGPPPWSGMATMLRKRNLPRTGRVGDGTRYFVDEDLVLSSHMGHDEPDYDANNPVVRLSQPVDETEYLTDAFSREACSFIRRYQSSPFFLCVTFNAVHSPLQAKKETLEEFAEIDDLHRRIFAAMLTDLDRGVGKIVDTLDSLNLRENTLIVFLSDNGGPTRELTSSNAPLRDGKGSMYEGGLRIPFIMNWSKAVRVGVCEQVVSSLDLYPTLCRVADAEVPEALDGYPLQPLLEDETATSPHRYLYWRQGGRAALRSGRYKIVAPQRRVEQRSWELYDVESDYAETRDLASKLPAVRQELIEQWEKLDGQMMAPIF
ncbi:MAG: sulfatase-like hydrolase/transferase [Planctomycetota bacterium]